MSKQKNKPNQMVSVRQLELQFIEEVKDTFDFLLKAAKVFAKNEEFLFGKKLKELQNEELELMVIKKQILGLNEYLWDPQGQLYRSFFTLGKRGLAKKVKELKATSDDEYYINIVETESNRVFSYPSMPREVTETERLERHLKGILDLKKTWGSQLFIQSLNRLLAEKNKQTKAVSSKVNSDQPKFGLPIDIAIDLANEIASYFNKKDISKLKKALQGKELKEKIYFKSSGNKLVDVFWKIHQETDCIKVTKIVTEDWLCKNFQYFDNGKKEISDFKLDTIKKYLERNSPTIKKEKNRIQISSFLKKYKKE